MRGRDVPKKNFKGIHDRFQKDLRYRDSQLKIGWTEDKCIEIDELAQKDFTYRPSTEEFERYKKNWYISLNRSAENAPMKLRSDFPNSSHNCEPSPPQNLEKSDLNQFLFVKHQRWHSSSSSSSTSWWQWNEKLVELIFFF